ncbi:MAG TPA: Bax inhibitor-1/YccA family protein [Saprospiraceae bacterium]|mgnify:CR=1 FL=1|nr:Bax inhibitor-1/YccA family protein [Saprospiraceae bacterium]HQW55117.1 Bax inhibitor-1/YccA family protein [Saprospiraceae bacterium]
MENYNKNADIDQIMRTRFPDEAGFSSYLSSYMSKVYGWMFFGLALTAVVGYYVASTPALISALMANRFLFFGLLIGELFLVGFLSVRIKKMSFSTALLTFLGYAALNGVTLSILLLVYTPASLATVFGITAVTFGIMSAVGYFTHQDLSKFGSILFMGLIGVIVASVVNIFLQNSVMYWIISYLGVAIFVGLIAYDTQKIKAYALLESESDRKKGAIMGALALYLDFINLFIFLLRLFGNRN